MAEGKKELMAGKNVLFDATFSNPWMWKMAENLLAQTQARLVPIEVVFEKISPKEIEKRLQKRFQKDPGAALPKTHFIYKNRYHPLRKKHFIVNNDVDKKNLQKQVKKIIESIS